MKNDFFSSSQKSLIPKQRSDSSEVKEISTRHSYCFMNNSRANKQLSYSYSAAGLLLMMQDSDGNSVFASLRISNHKFQIANYSLHNRLRQFGIWNSESVIARRASADYGDWGRDWGRVEIGVEPVEIGVAVEIGVEPVEIGVEPVEIGVEPEY